MRILIVGCGNISRAWVSAVCGEEGISIAALVDISLDRAEKTAMEFGLKEAVVSTDLGEALVEARPDIVFNCRA